MCISKTLTIVVIAIGILITGLHAESTNKFELYVNGALAFPLGPDDFSDYWRLGYLNVGGGVGYSIIPAISTNVYFDWCNFGFDGEKFAHDIGLGGEISIMGLDASVMTITGNMKVTIPSGTVRPYFWGGLGLFILSIDDGSVSGGGLVVPVPGDSENALGLAFGAGIDFAAAKTLDIFVDGRIVLGFTEGESTMILPLRLGLKVKLRARKKIILTRDSDNWVGE
jgi:hypothetical protein